MIIIIITNIHWHHIIIRFISVYYLAFLITYRHHQCYCLKCSRRYFSTPFHFRLLSQLCYYYLKCQHCLHAEPGDAMFDLVRNELDNLEYPSRGWILHGYPCDRTQAEYLHANNYEPNRWSYRIQYFGCSCAVFLGFSFEIIFLLLFIRK